MVKHDKISLFLAVGAMIVFAGSAAAQAPAGVAPDNSKSNRADSSDRNVTAEDQTNRPSDIDLTKRIRQSLMADKSLSTYAHNVKIVSVDGHVTLNGVVKTVDEKETVAARAEDVAGKSNVTNELKVANGS